jgi:hypothetical protein
VIGIVSCSATKLDRAAPARELYTSHLFKLSLAYALEHCEHVYIASARHGLVALDTELQPYNETLTGKSREHCDAWGFMVTTQLQERHPAAGGVMMLAGYAYTGPIRRHLPMRYVLIDVLHGMQIGQRLHFLKIELAAAAARRAA